MVICVHLEVPRTGLIQVQKFMRDKIYLEKFTLVYLLQNDIRLYW